MSQVFSVVCALTVRWFCFSRILKAGPRSMEVPDLKKILKARTSEKQTHYAHCVRGICPLKKIAAPPLARPLNPSRCHTPSEILLPHTFRWSEARRYCGSFGS